MITSTLAKKFAADFFALPAEDRTYDRLAHFAACFAQEISSEATRLEHERIQSKLAELIR